MLCCHVLCCDVLSCVVLYVVFSCSVLCSAFMHIHVVMIVLLLARIIGLVLVSVFRLSWFRDL